MVSIKTAMTIVGATAIVVAMAAGPAGTAGAAGVSAARTNYLTFSGPVALPGVQLQAGTYIFERATPDSHANVVRVLSRDRMHVYLLAFTRQVARPIDWRPGQAIALGEPARGVPPPVRVWYPIDELIGHEFIYPH